MVNRYEKPAEAQFLNTYVPIPFEQLFKLGQQAKADVDQATNQLTNTLGNWAKFTSPSQTDTETYYNETFGKVAPIVDQLSSNMDLLKSAEGRARLFSTLNNLDYSKLSQLTQSAQGLNDRIKATQDLMKAGKFNPQWHDLSFIDSYDTTSSGIFNDVAPVAYQSVQDIADPYVAGIKDSFLRSEGGYDYYGVKPETITGLITENRVGLLADPAAQEHVKTLMAAGMTKEQAENEFVKQASDAAVQKYARENRSENAFSLENLRHSNEIKQIQERNKKTGAGGSGGNTANEPASLTDQLNYVATDNLLNNIEKYPNVFANSSAALKDTTGTKEEQFQRYQTGLIEDARELYRSATGMDFNNTNSYKTAQAGTNVVLDAFKAPISSKAASSILTAHSVSKIKTERGEEFVTPTSEGLMLPDEFAGAYYLKTGRIGTKRPFETSRHAKYSVFADALKEGKYSAVGMQSLGDQFVYRDENGKEQQAIRVSVSLPIEDFEKRFKHVVKATGEEHKVQQSREEFIQNMEGYSVLYEGSDDKRKPTRVTFDAIKKINNDPATINWINQDYLNSQTSKTYSNNQYERFQYEAFGFDDE